MSQPTDEVMEMTVLDHDAGSSEIQPFLHPAFLQSTLSDTSDLQLDPSSLTEAELALAQKTAAKYGIDNPSDLAIESFVEGHRRRQEEHTTTSSRKRKRSLLMDIDPTPQTLSSLSPTAPFFAPASDTPLSLNEQLADFGTFDSRASSEETVVASSLSFASAPPTHLTDAESAIQVNDQDDDSKLEISETEYEDEPYMMSGALHASDPHPTSLRHHNVSDSNVICANSLSSLIHQQPFSLLSRDDIYKYMSSHFNDPSYIYHHLDDGDYITPHGLQIALKDANDDPSLSRYGCDDELLISAIKYKCGYVRGWKSVVYPEDLHPCVSSTSDFFEEDYWEKVWERGECWREWGMDDDKNARYGDDMSMCLESDERMEWEGDGDDDWGLWSKPEY